MSKLKIAALCDWLPTELNFVPGYFSKAQFLRSSIPGCLHIYIMVANHGGARIYEENIPSDGHILGTFITTDHISNDSESDGTPVIGFEKWIKSLKEKESRIISYAELLKREDIHFRDEDLSVKADRSEYYPNEGEWIKASYKFDFDSGYIYHGFFCKGLSVKPINPEDQPDLLHYIKIYSREVVDEGVNTQINYKRKFVGTFVTREDIDSKLIDMIGRVDNHLATLILDNQDKRIFSFKNVVLNIFSTNELHPSLHTPEACKRLPCWHIAADESYECATINGIDGYYISERITKSSLPEKLHSYEIGSINLDDETDSNVRYYKEKIESEEEFRGTFITHDELPIPSGDDKVYINSLSLHNGYFDFDELLWKEHITGFDKRRNNEFHPYSVREVPWRYAILGGGMFASKKDDIPGFFTCGFRVDLSTAPEGFTCIEIYEYYSSYKTYDIKGVFLTSLPLTSEQIEGIRFDKIPLQHVDSFRCVVGFDEIVRYAQQFQEEKKLWNTLLQTESCEEEE